MAFITEYHYHYNYFRFRIALTNIQTEILYFHFNQLFKQVVDMKDKQMDEI